MRASRALLSLRVGPAPSTVLGQAAAALSPGNWVQLSAAAGQQTAFTQSGAWLAGGSNNASFNPNRLEGHFVGKAQQSAGGTSYRHIIYDYATHSWSINGTAVNQQEGHGYDGNMIDPATGRVYFRPYAGHPTRTIHYADPPDYDDWSGTLPDWPLGPGSFVDVVQAFFFWSGALSGTTAGAVITYEVNGDRTTDTEFVIFDVGAGSWDASVNVSGGQDAYNAWGAYDPILNMAVAGGGATPGELHTLESDRSTNLLDSIPNGDNIGYLDGLLDAEPAQGGFIIVARSGRGYHLDPTQPGGSQFTQLTGGAAPPTSDIYDLINRGSICWADTVYKVLVFASSNSAGGDPQMWLYKHANP